jgi:D-alanine-D-alanine ligase
LAVALHKETAKRIVRSFGVPTPDFATVVSEADVSRLTLTGRLFAKPIAEGTGKGIGSASMVTNRQELLEVCRRLLHMYRQPVLVEQYLPGREFTVGIIGTGEQAEAIGVIEVVSRSTADAHAYGYENKEFCEERIDYVLASGDLADQAKRVSLAAWNALNCRDGGRVDVRADDTGVIHFLEVNPLAGLHPTHSDLPIVCGKVGISYRELIERIVKSALSRVQMF